MKKEKKVKFVPIPVPNDTICKYCKSECIDAVASHGFEILLEPGLNGPWIIEGSKRGKQCGYVFDNHNRILIGGTVPGRTVKKDDVRYQSHFATCSRNKDWINSYDKHKYNIK